MKPTQSAKVEEEVEIEEEEVAFVDQTEEEEEEKPLKLPSAKKKVAVTQPEDEEADEDEKAISQTKKKSANEAPKKPELKNNKKRTRVIQTPVRNDNYLRYILVAIVIGIVAVLYYYFKLLNHPLPEISSIFINNAVAQTSEPAPVIKKKVQLS